MPRVSGQTTVLTIRIRSVLERQLAREARRQRLSRSALAASLLERAL
jgi:hypothetical protein